MQETIQQLITPLVRALGPTHGKLLTLLRTFPPGAESLALRVLNIFTETGRPSAQLVALVKSLVNERDLDARFLIPIIAEMDKVFRPGLSPLWRVLIPLPRPTSCGICLASCPSSMAHQNPSSSCVPYSVPSSLHPQKRSVKLRLTYRACGKASC